MGGYYLDGNFIRTSLLYGLFRSQGVVPRPWRPTVSVGACPTPEGVDLVLATTSPWSGRLVFDRPRHAEWMDLPFEYPRLNGWPEWFTVTPTAQCSVIDMDSGSVQQVSGRQLREGLPLEIDAPARIRIEVRCGE